MSRIIDDAEILDLLKEEKPLPSNWESRMKPIPKADCAFKQRTLDLIGSTGRNFRVSVRRNELSLLDFSIILVFVDSDGGEYRLTRFNGSHPSQHTNKWEKWNGERKHSFKNVPHIHLATERYQRSGLEIDGYATPSKAYNSFEEAMELFIRSNGFRVKSEEVGYGTLFDQTGN